MKLLGIIILKKEMGNKITTSDWDSIQTSESFKALDINNIKKFFRI